MRRLVFHPLLIAALPVFYLYSYSVRQSFVAPKDAVLPLILSVAGAAALWLVLWLCIRNAAKSGLITTIVVTVFFLYGAISGLVAHVWSGLRYWELACLLLTLIVLASWPIIRTRRDMAGVSLGLNVAGAFLILFNIVTSIPSTLAAYRASTSRPRATPAVEKGHYPDIYDIILDAHARADILASMYHYDDTWFVDSLRQLGFYVVSQARTNYPQTYLSVASTLNMTYLDSLARAVGPQSTDRRPLLRFVVDNRVMRELRSRGYRIVSFTSGYTGTEFENADIHLAPRWVSSEFLYVLLVNTALGPGLLRDLGLKYWADQHRARIRYVLEHLPDAARMDGPAFTFAHMICPHPPFVFGPHGEPLNGSNASKLADANHLHHMDPALVQKYVADYRGQVEFIDHAILKAIGGILANSPTPPVIIVYGDHGPGSRFDLDDLWKSYFPERMEILYAIHLPDHDYRGWYDSLSRVNTYRLLFDRLFGDTLSLLPDRSYVATWKQPYQYFDVDTFLPR
ncbi:MAG TPA: hypothetical protein VMH22_06525 [bacterium]|nr:hypothetical protein [bacterium]